MPPEITAVLSSAAGLMALAGAPPGVAASAGLSPPEPLGASLFAAFLAQSSPLSVPPAAPKAAALQTLTADLKQTPLDTRALPKSKTMDTLPTLSFPAAPRSKAKASELPFPAAGVHQKDAQDQSSAGGAPAPNAPGSVPALAGQTMPPVLFAAPALPLPVAAVTVPVAAVTVPVASAPGPTASAVPLVQAAPERSALAAPIRRDMPTLDLSRAAVSDQTPSVLPAPALPVPAQIGLPLPRTWAISALLQAVPQTVPTPAAGTPAGPMPSEPKAVSLLAVKPASVTAESATTTAVGRALPRVPGPVFSAPQTPAAPLQAVPQEAIPGPAPLAASQNAPNLTVTAATAALSVAPPPAAEPTPLSPAKTTGKFLPAALKPAGKSADTSTRTTAEQVPSVGAKTSASAAAPEPMPEKRLEEQPFEAGGGTRADGGGTNSVPTFSQAGASAETVKAEMKPLSAQDRAEVVRQAADGVGAMPLTAKPGAPEQMSIQLHPKDWGSLQVSVTVAPSQNAGAAKTVTAHIVAETPQVKAALQSGTGALHQALRASGLRLEHLTVSVKALEGKTMEVKPAAQSAPAGLSSGQRQAEQPAQSYGQPGAGSSGFGASHFGTGGSQDNRQGQPPPLLLPDAEPDDTSAAGTPLRPAAGRVDTRA